MTRTRSRSRKRALSVWSGAAVLGAAMLGNVVVSAPPASAGCTLSNQDEKYINLLAQNKMIHTADYNDCQMVAEGHWFADQVRKSSDPLGTAKNLVNMAISTTPMSEDKAEYEVEAAIYTYAPEMIPKIKDQFTQQIPVESGAA